jgi:hypothetical protein
MYVITVAEGIVSVLKIPGSTCALFLLPSLASELLVTSDHFTVYIILPLKKVNGIT